jgi:hypothetical protein
VTKAPEYYCHIHPLTILVCPRCIAKKGGIATAKRYGTKQLASWGASGGRPTKKKKAKKKKRSDRARR